MENKAIAEASSVKNPSVIKYRKYWKQRLDGAAIDQYFYNGGTSNNTNEEDFLTTSFCSSKETMDSLNSLANSPQAKHLVLLAALSILAQKYSLQEDVVLFATPYLSDQHHLKDVNVIPIRIQQRPGENFKDVLGELKQNFVQDLSHSDYIRSRGLDAINPDFKEELIVAMSIEGITERISNSKVTPGMSCHFIFSEGIVLDITFNTLIYNESLINTIQSHYFYLLDRLLAVLDQPIQSISLVNDTEQERLLSKALETNSPLKIEASVLNLFDRHVKNNPNVTAVFYEGSALNYRELDVKSNQLAHYLIETHFIKQGDVIAMLMDRSENLVIVALAILKAGATYVPIDQKSPKDRIKTILEDAAPKLLIAEMYYGLDMDYYEGDKFFVDIQLEGITTSESPVERKIAANDLAYIIYTSGTSGKPKGVMVHHEAIANLVQHQLDYFGVSEGEHVLQFSPFYFDASVEQMWLALCSGSKLFMLSESTIKNQADFNSYIKENSITHLHATPSYLDAIELGDDLSLKRIIAGGEVCSAMTAHKFIPKYPFYNEYGPTETTVTSTECLINDAMITSGVLPIGKPIANTHIYILDRHLNLMPEGLIGDLYIGGKGVAKGYLNRPELTADSFISSPFDHAKVLYKTGDMVKWLPDGNLEFSGRNDTQVKIRGHRIEMGEIVYQISKLPEIDRVAVVGKKFNNGETELVAYVKWDGEPLVDKLKETISRKLPEYMVPHIFVELSEFPLTANGKINLNALPEPKLKHDENYVAPSDDLELLVVTIWSEVLDIDAGLIGVHKDFFELGMNSINAFQTVIKLKGRLSKSVEIADVFEHNTVAKLAKFLASTNLSDEGVIPKVIHKELNVVSSAQERMYFSYLLDPESLVYNIANAVEISGEFDMEQFNKALEYLVERHPSLRTSFVHNIDGIFQQIHDGIAIDFKHIQNSNIDIKLCFEEFIKPHDLSQGQPIRFLLIDREPFKKLLFVDVHHIVCDGYSLSILVSDLRTLLNNGELPPLEVDYVDYSLWQQNRSDELEAQRAYWHKKLARELQPIELTVIDEMEDVDMSKANMLSVQIASEEYSAIIRYIHENGLTNFMFFIAVYYLLLHKITGNTDIVIGSDVIGRVHSSLRNLVGTFVNILPLRVTVEPEESSSDFMQRVKECVLEGFAHQEYQYDAMLELITTDSSKERPTLAQVHFAFDDLSGENNLFEAGDLTFTAVDLERQETTQYEFKIEGTQLEDNYLLRFISSEKLYEEETIRLFSTYYLNILKTIILNPSVKIGNINLV